MILSSNKIIFAGQFYRWSETKKGMLDDLGPWGLWQIHPDGTGLRALTDDRHDVGRPWSSHDRTWIFQERSTDQPMFGRLSVTGNRVETLPGPVLKPLEDSPDARPSPDKKRIAYAVNGDAGEYHLVIYDIRRKRTLKVIRNVGDFAWSPDSQRLYLIRSKTRAAFYEWETGKESPAPYMRNPSWLADGTLIGDTCQDFLGKFPLIRGHVSSAKVETILIAPEADPKGGEDGEHMFAVRHHWWHPIPGRPDALVVETLGQMSDGEHFNCFFVDMKRRGWRLLSHGKLIGIHPSGRYIATAGAEWVGPYKRGGRRCGPLEIVDLLTDKRRAITTNLVNITGGFWM